MEDNKTSDSKMNSFSKSSCRTKEKKNPTIQEENMSYLSDDVLKSPNFLIYLFFILFISLVISTVIGNETYKNYSTTYFEMMKLKWLNAPIQPLLDQGDVKLSYMNAYIINMYKTRVTVVVVVVVYILYTTTTTTVTRALYMFIIYP